MQKPIRIITTALLWLLFAFIVQVAPPVRDNVWVAIVLGIILLNVSFIILFNIPYRPVRAVQMDEYTTPEEALAPYRRYLPPKLYNWILERAYVEQAAREGKAKRRLTTSDDELHDFTLLSEDEDGHIAQQK